MNSNYTSTIYQAIVQKRIPLRHESSPPETRTDSKLRALRVKLNARTYGLVHQALRCSVTSYIDMKIETVKMMTAKC